MFIIKRKRILIIFSIIFISIYVSVLEINYRNDLKVVETVSVPVSNKVIVVDAGHGTPDEGAESSNGTTEAEINLKIALKLQKLLEQSGTTVILTRSDENGIYESNSDSIREKKISDMHNRVTIGNESGADIFISIHLNKINESQYDGWQTFYKKGSEESKSLAEYIQESLNNSMQRENNRIPAMLNSIYLMKNIEIPICLVECGFLSNIAPLVLNILFVFKKITLLVHMFLHIFPKAV